MNINTSCQRNEHQFAPTEWLQSNSQTITSIGKDVPTSHAADRNANATATLENSPKFLKCLNIKLLHDLAIPFVGIHLKELNPHKNLYTSVHGSRNNPHVH